AARRIVAAFEQVVAAASAEDVVAGTARERVVEGAAGQRVGAGRARQRHAIAGAGRIVAVEEGRRRQRRQRGAGERREQRVRVAAAVEVDVQLDVVARLFRLQVAETERIAVEVVTDERAQVQLVAGRGGKVGDRDR